MIAALAILNANKNIIAVVGLVMLGGLIVTGIYTAGQRAERNKTAAEMAPINTSIVADRGKDEAEIASDAKDADKIDAAVKAALNARFILDEDTAKLLGSVK
jgi:hypothetical protein